MENFKGKVAVITGGNSGIGLATAKLFREHGAKIAIAGRDKKTLDDAVGAMGSGAIGVQADLRDLGDLDRLFETVSRRFGKVDVLFANAGVAKFAPMADTPESLYDEMFDTNVKGTFFTIQKALPHLNDGAAIVLNTTVFSHKGSPGTSAYSASKAAVRSLVRVAATELVGRGIRVNAVSPGPIVTPIFGRTGLPKEALDAFAQNVLAQVPMKRFGQPEEVARTVLFLASSEASYITGGDIEVGGGMGQV